ncbi:hypothetical protein BS17DRAFT_545148 [Gyrodon lividus]|nr:hypothetical protein BS17DRAFT_545148 [Gyrodon lividus]
MLFNPQRIYIVMQAILYRSSSWICWPFHAPHHSLLLPVRRCGLLRAPNPSQHQRSGVVLRHGTARSCSRSRFSSERHVTTVEFMSPVTSPIYTTTMYLAALSPIIDVARHQTTPTPFGTQHACSTRFSRMGTCGGFW